MRKFAQSSPQMKKNLSNRHHDFSAQFLELIRTVMSMNGITRRLKSRDYFLQRLCKEQPTTGFVVIDRCKVGCNSCWQNNSLKRRKWWCNIFNNNTSKAMQLMVANANQSQQKHGSMGSTEPILLQSLMGGQGNSNAMGGMNQLGR